MPKTFIKKTAGWTEIKSIFVKKTTGWTEVKNVFIKKTAGWVKVFTKASLPDTTTAPSIRTTNNSGTGTIYDGPVATSPQYLNEDLFGKDGVYTNYISISGRKFTYGDSASALTRTTVVNDDRFTSAGGVTTAQRISLDEQYLFYELTVSNGTGNEIYPISPAIKMIKSVPVGSSTITTSDITVGSTVTYNYTIENYYYNRLETSGSTIRWWRSTSTNAGGTLLKTETVAATTTSSTSTSLSGTSSYVVTSADNNFYIVVEIIPENSWIRHFGYSGSYSFAPKSTALVGSVFSITAHSMVDDYGNSGLDNREELPVDGFAYVQATIVGVDTTTTFRTRYRVFNWQSGTYYQPSTGTLSTENGSWESYTSDYYNVGNISEIVISGSTAYLRDYLGLSSFYFDGGTYSGGLSKWQVEIEISAIKNGKARIYYQGAPYISYYLSRASNSTLNLSPNPAATNSSVTISGSFTGQPAGTAYPKAYNVDYGDGTSSGWNYFSYGTGNPTYSLSKSYSSAGTYYPTVTTIPYYTATQQTLTVAAGKTAPTITAVSSTVQNAPVTVYFSGGSGPFYQMYWTSGVAPTVPVTPDASGSTSPLTDSTGPSGVGTYNMYVRSVATAGETSLGPSPLASAWSSPFVFTVASSNLTAPTISSVSVSNAGGSVSVFFSGGSGPFYQAFWWTSATAPTGQATPDASGSSSPLTDTTGPSSTTTQYMYVRSVKTVGELSLGPSDLASSWSAGVAFNMTQPPIIPTITMAANSGVSQTGGTINWTSTNQSSFSANGTFAATGTTGTSISKTGLTASTTYTGTVTVTSSTGNTASANYSLTTTATPTYTITYDGNGATGGSTTATTGSGTVTLRANGFTRTNCSFSGWATSAGGAVSYPAGFSYNLTANVTLYAVWAAVANSATAPSGFKFDGNNLPTAGRKRWSWTGTGTVTGGVRTGFRVQISSTSATSGFALAPGSPLATSARSYDIAVSPVTSARWLRIASEYTDGLGVARVGTFTTGL